MMKRKILNLTFITAIMFSTLVFTGVEAFAVEPQSKQSVNLQSRVGLLTHQHQADNTLIAAVPAAQNAASDKQIPTTDAKKPEAIPQKNAYAMEKNTGFKYAIIKFLTAMLGVLLSCLAIFAGLKFYKKIVLKSDLKQTEIDYDKTLESPKNFKEAINLFLHKTRK